MSLCVLYTEMKIPVWMKSWVFVISVVQNNNNNKSIVSVLTILIIEWCKIIPNKSFRFMFFSKWNIRVECGKVWFISASHFMWLLAISDLWLVWVLFSCVCHWIDFKIGNWEFYTQWRNLQEVIFKIFKGNQKLQNQWLKRFCSFYTHKFSLHFLILLLLVYVCVDLFINCTPDKRIKYIMH